MEGNMKLKAKMILFVLATGVCLILVFGCGDDCECDDEGCIDGGTDTDTDTDKDSGTDSGVCDNAVCENSSDDGCSETILLDGGVEHGLIFFDDGFCVPDFGGSCLIHDYIGYVVCEFGCIEQPGDDVCAENPCDGGSCD